MKRIVLIVVFMLVSVSFAERFRLLDTPRCIIDLDVSKNIVDVSKCPVFQDQYYGDSTFMAGILCHDTEGLNINNTIHIVPRSLYEDDKEMRASYFEVTARTKYSFKVDFIVKFAGKEPVVFPTETLFEWLRSGRIDECSMELSSPHKVKQIGR